MAAEQRLDVGVRHLEGVLGAGRGPVAGVRGLRCESHRIGRQGPACACEEDGIAYGSVEILGPHRAGAREPPATIDEHPDADAARAGEPRGFELAVCRRDKSHPRLHHSCFNVRGAEPQCGLDGGFERLDEAWIVESHGVQCHAPVSFVVPGRGWLACRRAERVVGIVRSVSSA